MRGSELCGLLLHLRSANQRSLLDVHDLGSLLGHVKNLRSRFHEMRGLLSAILAAETAVELFRLATRGLSSSSGTLSGQRL